MSTCKTCAYWMAPGKNDSYKYTSICTPRDPDTFQPMDRGFETRICRMPTQTLFEAPVESNSFALTDGSEYLAVLATGEDFGCVRHQEIES